MTDVQVRQQPKTVVIWSALGVLALAVQFYVFSRWILSSGFRPTPLGADPVPESVRVIILSYQAVSIAMAIIALVWFVRGIRRTGTIDSTRLLMIGWISAYWLDPWLDFLRPMFTYSAYAFNRGCWCQYIPGWQAPHGSLIPEPLLIDAPNYFVTFTLTALAGLWFIKRAKARWPGLGNLGMALAGFMGVWITMSALDIVATRYMGFDAWPGAVQSLSIWGGKPYQFPIYEFLAFPSPFIACAFLLYYADASGQTVIERGVDQIAAKPWMKTTLRILAFVAFCNLLNLFYTSALGVHALFVDPWPAHMPSWLADGQCGPTTGLVCKP